MTTAEEAMSKIIDLLRRKGTHPSEDTMLELYYIVREYTHPDIKKSQRQSFCPDIYSRTEI